MKKTFEFNGETFTSIEALLNYLRKNRRVLNTTMSDCDSFPIWMNDGGQRIRIASFDKFDGVTPRTCYEPLFN